MASLLSAFDAAVARWPDRVALIDGRGHSTSFAALGRRARGLARAWHARGIGPGDRVLLAMRLDADLYAGLAALWSLGATVVLPEPAMGLAGLRHAARLPGLRAFCSSGAYGALPFVLPSLWRLTRLRPHPAAGPALALTPPDEDVFALISFTSGTTGTPKAIPRSHAFLSAQRQAVAPVLDSAVGERDLVTFPVFVLINLAQGRTSILPGWRMTRLRHLSAQTLSDWVARHGATRALLPPALCDKLADAPIPPQLHTVFTGGGPVFPDILIRLREARPGLRVVCVYGSTEAEPIAHLEATALSQTDLDRMRAGDGLLVGTPEPDLHLRIEDDEILVAGPHVNAGYLDPRHDAENKVNRDGVIWHRTGDAGRRDAAGRLWLLGRHGSEVEVKGKRVLPFTVEVAARFWPGVRQAALVSHRKAPCLVLEGDPAHLPTWQRRASALGLSGVVPLDAIPMDRRHASKIDRRALSVMLARHST
ncbi:MAG: AMP-binding protein [Pseudomonadota bacterium]